MDSVRQRKNATGTTVDGAAAATKTAAQASTAKAIAEAPAKSGRTPTRVEKVLLVVVICVLCTPSLLAYWYYGIHFFIPPELTRLRHTAEEWQEMLRNRTVVMVGGPHYGGTSILWESLGAHPKVSSFGSRRETGADHSEGIFVQSVYPRFGVGQEFSRGVEGGKGQQRCAWARRVGGAWAAACSVGCGVQWR